jgi:hypothetical protein
MEKDGEEEEEEEESASKKGLFSLSSQSFTSAEHMNISSFSNSADKQRQKRFLPPSSVFTPWYSFKS